MKETIRDIQNRKTEDFEIFRAKMENEYRENAEKIVQCERFHCDNEKREIRMNFEVPTEIIIITSKN